MKTALHIFIDFVFFLIVGGLAFTLGKAEGIEQTEARLGQKTIEQADEVISLLEKTTSDSDVHQKLFTQRKQLDSVEREARKGKMVQDHADKTMKQYGQVIKDYGTMTQKYVRSLQTIDSLQRIIAREQIK